MKEKIISSIFFFAILSLVLSCLEPYNPQATQTNVNFLTVEGFLTGVDGPTTIQLSRTLPVGTGNDKTKPEKNASVQIEGDDGSAYMLPELSPGIYTAKLAVDPVKTFRLKIKTSDQKEYASDFVPFKQTPAIDSVNTVAAGDQLQIFVNAHDDTGNTRYYLWRYVETWSYHSAYQTDLKFENHVVVKRDPLEDIYHCWKTVPSSMVVIGSSARLERDIISNYQLVSMPFASEKLQAGYSLFVQQFALTKDAFEYWQQLKVNTENIGTLFGPQPSQISVNIHCLTNPEEPVVGYFSGCTVRQQRIFIKGNPDIKHNTGYELCKIDTLFLANVPSFMGNDLLVGEAYRGMTFLGYLRSTPFCVDCRLHGGTTVRPDFWK